MTVARRVAIVCLLPILVTGFPANSEVAPMKVPQELEYLATCFFSRSDLEYSTTQEWVRTTVRQSLTAEQKKVVWQFLDELLSASQTDDDLQRLWQRLDSDYRFNSGAAVRRFLGMIRDASG